MIVGEGDPFSGLMKLMDSLQSLHGATDLDRKGDLRAQFHQEMKRQRQERIATFCSRFRTLCGEMKREGIDLPREELGWFLRERLGLDPLRKQLLETALAGRESYEEVEAECLRLFRDLHTADPLYRRQMDQRSPLLHRFLSGQSASSHLSISRPPTTFSGSSSFSCPGSFKSSASSRVSSRFKKPGTLSTPPRQSLVTEQFDEAAAEDEEELVPDEAEEAATPSLEEVLPSEVEVLASELHDAEEEGVSGSPC